ncbi:hypothetical protein [Cohaesibacter marisflavi]|uniref:hypothetical protein n=1 Tax=Cohaesibacter marisflavi TaxID=655353 RepID=UPI000B7EA2CA|nr:hypothetical protein [Cohaesibacter marisflavi]
MSLIFNLIVILVKLAPSLASLLAQLSKFSADHSSGSVEKNNDLVKKPRTASKDLHDAMVAKWGGGAAQEARYVPEQTADPSFIDLASDELRKSDGFKRQ